MTENRPRVVIIDYGMGNLFSLQRVINHLGGIPVIASDFQTIESADRLILPGVGAFGDGMQNLKRQGLIGTIKSATEAGKPLLGICLGMQLLMTESEEFGLHEGLNLVKGRVVKFQEPCSDGAFYKIPHVGWNYLNYPSGGDSREVTTVHQKDKWRGTILNKTRQGSYFYFVHSYVVVPESPDVIGAETEYGRERFCSALRQQNIYGCQFHPEVSGEVGLQMLREFLLNT